MAEIFRLFRGFRTRRRDRKEAERRANLQRFGLETDVDGNVIPRERQEGASIIFSHTPRDVMINRALSDEAILRYLREFPNLTEDAIRNVVAEYRDRLDSGEIKVPDFLSTGIRKDLKKLEGEFREFRRRG